MDFRVLGEPLGYWAWMTVYVLQNLAGPLSAVLFLGAITGLVYRRVAPKTGEGHWIKPGDKRLRGDLRRATGIGAS